MLHSSMTRIIGCSRCPVTGKRIFEENHVRQCLSLMNSCGMYDYSGEFAFHIGFPSKAASSGVMLVVIPNKLGICTWCPSLDSSGNSVRGLEFCKLLSQRFNFHQYDNLSSKTGKVDPTLHKGSDQEKQLGDLIEAASKSDVRELQLLQNLHGAELLSLGDYDNRTALHLACAEGNEAVVKYLVNVPEVRLEAEDRWGVTPLQEALSNQHNTIAQIVEKAIYQRKQRQQQQTR